MRDAMTCTGAIMTTKDYSNVTYQVARRIEDGRTVWINDAKRQRIQPRSLVCLNAECHTPVFARTGSKRKWHFCHYRDEYKKKCKRDVKFSHGESAMHLICKHFLASENSRCCYVDAVCVRCHVKREVCRYTRGMEAQIEHSIADGKYIIDVALLDKVSKKVVAAVEVFHTHKVDYEKAEYMRQNGIALLEVDTSQIKEVMDKKKGMICLKVVGYDDDRHVCDTCMYKDAWYRHIMMVVQRENEYEAVIAKEYTQRSETTKRLKREYYGAWCDAEVFTAVNRECEYQATVSEEYTRRWEVVREHSEALKREYYDAWYEEEVRMVVRRNNAYNAMVGREYIRRSELEKRRKREKTGILFVPWMQSVTFNVY
jgi:hypothetical protein